MADHNPRDVNDNAQNANGVISGVSDNTLKRIHHQRIRDVAEKLKAELMENMNNQVEELLDGFVSSVQQIENGDKVDPERAAIIKYVSYQQLLFFTSLL
ncbi:hypothetical protein ElyMa_004729000 [Elysia marginata]|uniref:Uncharacterized protein n=1 Tax=Elysia marginata TaxID=1093978 RepID=A0AAV4IAA2_9GAST|nr:hypothetical protein ElyMa_004729000 [Elysia marginata]